MLVLDNALVPYRCGATASTAVTEDYNTYKVTVEEPDSIAKLSTPFRTGLRSAPAPETPYRIPRLPLPKPSSAPKVHRLSNRKSAVLADKQAKKDHKVKQKKKNVPRHKRFCKVCQVSCNSAKVFYDHTKSKGHRIRVENKKCTPHCDICDRTFESHEHLSRHRNGAAHLKVVLRSKSDS